MRPKVFSSFLAYSKFAEQRAIKVNDLNPAPADFLALP